ncbi:nucleotide 5'-monophosphate nucleosidase PpnN [Oceanospirillum sanctuarii]|uniref:nucleotide 5'-monophosphate nucleosidase PpnN n=1 Tax=Oceanospirillum sanctuarii TaxID=1434821 RepID=UPI0024819DF9|nr:nucleotide 5'-monophosphate nucleosidase PpnN [Oceanospirillum sanctuarii]
MTMKTNTQGIDTRISPEGSLEVLSQTEVNRLKCTSENGQYDLLRGCALAVLNCGSHTDDSKAILEQNKAFDIEVLQQDRGIKIHLTQAPASAFVDGEMIRGIREHLSSVLRDIVYVSSEVQHNSRFDLNDSEGITNAIFHILRNAGTLKANHRPDMVVCWGGHSISREEYRYTKDVGHELGLRGLNVCTGCGPGAMKGPMKGANLAHAKQRIQDGRYLGISEPGIIAAESPNPIVNELVIMPDIEKRLEAFVRVGHGIIVFPGGAGTAEEILYLLGVLLNPQNDDIPFPVIFTGPESSRDYWQQINQFIGLTLGYQAQQRYKIIIDDPARVAREISHGIDEVEKSRRINSDAFYFNWRLKISPEFQQPFEPTHENMAALNIRLDQPTHLLAANLRRAFSGIVAGNVKAQGITAIEQFGPFQINGDEEIMAPLDALLQSFVQQQRMKLPGTEYNPCYEIAKDSE